jgi:hypothetical protein
MVPVRRLVDIVMDLGKTSSEDSGYSGFSHRKWTGGYQLRTVNTIVVKINSLGFIKDNKLESYVHF